MQKIIKSVVRLIPRTGSTTKKPAVIMRISKRFFLPVPCFKTESVFCGVNFASPLGNPLPSHQTRSRGLYLLNKILEEIFILHDMADLRKYKFLGIFLLCICICTGAVSNDDDPVTLVVS